VPMINCAAVPTMISVSAVETRSHTDNKLAISAKPAHNVKSAHTVVIFNPSLQPRAKARGARSGRQIAMDVCGGGSK
jgi:hypothetical protein